MKRFVFLLLFSAFSIHLTAQDFSFIVVFKKGEIVSESAAGTQKLLIGSTVGKDESVVLDKGEHVVLMHKSGVSTELNKPGKYPVKEVLERIPDTVLPQLMEFQSFIADKMKMYEDLVIKRNRKKNSTVAGISRAVDDKKYVRVLLDEGSQNWLYGNEAMLKWVSDDSLDNEFILSIKDLYTKTLVIKSLKQDYYSLQLDSEELKDEEYVVVSVSSGNSEVSPKDYFLHRIPAGEKRLKIENDLSFFGDDIATHYLLRALYFEQRDLDVDALRAYHKAAELSPDMEVYSTLRDKFIYSKTLEAFR